MFQIYSELLGICIRCITDVHLYVFCVCLTVLRTRVRGFLYRIFRTGNLDTRVWQDQ